MHDTKNDRAPGLPGDAGSPDLFTQISRETDKDPWFPEAHLPASR